MKQTYIIDFRRKIVRFLMLYKQKIENLCCLNFTNDFVYVLKCLKLFFQIYNQFNLRFSWNDNLHRDKQ
jgi:hypothetical protein